METVQELRQQSTADPRASEGAGIQAGAYLLELSLDWIVRRHPRISTTFSVNRTSL